MEPFSQYYHNRTQEPGLSTSDRHQKESELEGLLKSINIAIWKSGRSDEQTDFTQDDVNVLVQRIKKLTAALQDEPLPDHLQGVPGETVTALHRLPLPEAVIEALSALETVIEEKGLPGKLFAKEKKHDPAKAGFLTTKQHHAKKDAAAKKQKDAVQSAFTPPWMKKKKPADDSKALAKK